MYLFFILGRRLPARAGAPAASPSGRMWSRLVADLASGIDADQVASYGPVEAQLSKSRKSPFGEHAAVLSFWDHAEACRASSILMDRLLLNVVDTTTGWALTGRLFEIQDRIQAKYERHDNTENQRFPEVPGLYLVSWRPDSDVEAPFKEWYHDHLRWNSETYHAVDAIRFTAVETQVTPVTYPFNWLVLYWFATVESLNDMCVDLTERYRKGWADASRWGDVSFIDRAPFAAERRLS